MPQVKGHQAGKILFYSGAVNLFVLVGVLTIWMRPTITWEDNLLYSVYQCKC